jgi:hypothetical protein
MRRLLPLQFVLILGSFFASNTGGYAQSLKKYPISNSACSLYSYCPSKYDVDFSDDSSTVYTGECKSGDVTYGVICIKLLRPVDDLDKAEEK